MFWAGFGVGVFVGSVVACVVLVLCMAAGGKNGNNKG